MHVVVGLKTVRCWGYDRKVRAKSRVKLETRRHFHLIQFKVGETLVKEHMVCTEEAKEVILKELHRAETITIHLVTGEVSESSSVPVKVIPLRDNGKGWDEAA